MKITITITLAMIWTYSPSSISCFCLSLSLRVQMKLPAYSENEYWLNLILHIFFTQTMVENLQSSAQKIF